MTDGEGGGAVGGRMAGYWNVIKKDYIFYTYIASTDYCQSKDLQLYQSHGENLTIKPERSG